MYYVTYEVDSLICLARRAYLGRSGYHVQPARSDADAGRRSEKRAVQRPPV